MDKILKIQNEIGTLVKDKENPFFHSNYLDINSLLEQLIPKLAENGLTVLQPLSYIQDWQPGVGFGSIVPALRTIVKDGDKVILDDKVPLPNLPDPQKMGSAITYYRRYALQSLFLLRAEDDDGNKGSGKKVDKNVDEDLEF